MSKHQVGRKGAVLLRISRIFGMETTLNKLGWLHNSHLINGEQMIIRHKFYCVKSHWDYSGCVCVWVCGKNRSMWTWTIFFLGKIVRKCEFFSGCLVSTHFYWSKTHSNAHTKMVGSITRPIHKFSCIFFVFHLVCVCANVSMEYLPSVYPSPGYNSTLPSNHHTLTWLLLSNIY